jgi:glycosyltransferase involved in cell wall biosynthesis
MTTEPLDITVIVLTLNEKLHIRRCIENAQRFAKRVCVVDCYSTDDTCDVAAALGAEVFQHAWEKNHARQFNWALANIPITTRWIFRLDADEYLTDELIAELRQKLPTVGEDVSGIVCKRRHVFLGKWVKRGVYPVKLLRLFRAGKGICEQRWMDEHIQLSEGRAVEFTHDFVDHNVNTIGWWTQKHNGYAIREAIELLVIELGDLTEKTDQAQGGEQLSEQASKKRGMKRKYAKAPLFWRSFTYFVYRYFVRLGFLDGKEGFLWHFLQGWWYRTLVDAKVFEIKKACGTDKRKIVAYVRENYAIDCTLK